MMLVIFVAILTPWMNASQGIFRLKVAYEERMTPVIRSVVLAECNERHQDGSELIPPDTLLLVLWPGRNSDDPLHLLWFARVEDQDCRLPAVHWSSARAADRAPPRLLV